jgi:hypothetical protein
VQPCSVIFHFCFVCILHTSISLNVSNLFLTGQVAQLREANKAHSGELKLFLEVELGL